MKREREHQLARICARQHGIITREQLVHDVGVSDNGVKRLVASNRLTTVRRGVYLVAGPPPSLLTALYAATTGTRTSFISHRGGAQLWRLPGGANLVEVASPRWRRIRGDQLAGFELVVHESLHLAEQDVVELDGIWRTRVPRTLIDLGASVALGHIDSETLTFAIQDAVRRNLTDLVQLESTFERLAPNVRIGARQFRQALDRFEPALNDTESRPELRVGRILLNAGFRVIPQYELELTPGWTVRLDFFLPDYHHGVEVSPFWTHGDARKRAYDNARELEVRARHGIEISVVDDEELEQGCRRLLAVLRTLRLAA